MEITIFGWIVIPLGLGAWFLGRNYLLPFAIFFSVFQAASVVNVRSIGYSLSPYYFICILIAIRVFLTGPDLWQDAMHGAARRLWSRMIFLALWVIISSVMLPLLFSGIGVYTPRQSMDDQYEALTPLVWSLANLAQDIYLLLNLIFLMSVWRYAKRVGAEAKLHSAFYLTGFLVLMVGIYQKLCLSYGWSFPLSFIYSNIQLEDIGFDNLSWGTRVFSTFSEPSLFGGFLVAYIMFVLILVMRETSGGLLLYGITLILAAMLLIWSAATTGYMAFGLAFGWFVWNQILSSGSRKKKVNRRLTIILSVLLGAITITLISGGKEMLDQVLLQKGDSLSAVYRLAADSYAGLLLLKTAGLGVGLGSNRPSSFLMYLLSNIGIPGVFLFSGMLLALTRLRTQVESFSRTTVLKGLDAASWGLGGGLLAMLIAIPDFNWPPMWVLLALVLVSVRSAYPQQSAQEIPAIRAVQVKGCMDEGGGCV